MQDNGERSAAAKFNRQHADAFAPVSAGLRLRRLFTESTGTAAIVLIDCGAAAVEQASGDPIGNAGKSLAVGLVLMAVSMTMGDVSGAHFNPASTLAFALRRAFPWRQVPLYWLAQITGAFAATALLRLAFPHGNDLGVTHAERGVALAWGAEWVTTGIRVAVVLGTATRHRVLGPNAALSTGGVTAACAIVARSVSGASMNPARSLAPAVMTHATRDLWIYLSAPLAGAVTATLFIHVIHHRRHAEERSAATGEPKAPAPEDG